MSEILKVRDLSISFAVRDDSFLAVDNISFDIQRNQTMASVSYTHLRAHETPEHRGFRVGG